MYARFVVCIQLSISKGKRHTKYFHFHIAVWRSFVVRSHLLFIIIAVVGCYMVGTSCKYCKQYALLRLNINGTNKTLVAAAASHLLYFFPMSFSLSPSLFTSQCQRYFSYCTWRENYTICIVYVDNFVPAPSDTQPIHHIRIINLIDKRLHDVSLFECVRCVYVIYLLCVWHTHSFIRFHSIPVESNPIHLMSCHFSYWLHYLAVI